MGFLDNIRAHADEQKAIQALYRRMQNDKEQRHATKQYMEPIGCFYTVDSVRSKFILRTYSRWLDLTDGSLYDEIQEKFEYNANNKGSVANLNYKLDLLDFSGYLTKSEFAPYSAKRQAEIQRRISGSLYPELNG